MFPFLGGLDHLVTMPNLLLKGAQLLILVGTSLVNLIGFESRILSLHHDLSQLLLALLYEILFILNLSLSLVVLCLGLMCHSTGLLFDLLVDLLYLILCRLQTRIH